MGNVTGGKRPGGNLTGWEEAGGGGVRWESAGGKTPGGGGPPGTLNDMFVVACRL